jgi:hypothetical protein
MRKHSLAAGVRVSRSDALGQRPNRAGALKGQGAGAVEQRFDGPPQLRPKFDLSGNRPLGEFPGETGVQHDFVGQLDRLAHAFKVAKCYREDKG